MLLTSSRAAAEVYKWVDKDGVTHYSDRPAPGSTEVAIPPAQTYQAPTAVAQPAVGASLPAAPATGTGNAPGVTCHLRSPQPDEVLVNVREILLVFQGPENTSAQLLLNNKRYTATSDTNSIKVQPAVRGTYEAKLRFVNARNEEVCKVPTVTFYVRQPSIINSPVRRKQAG
jgi:Domain of unknown function (DUF4124)